MEPVTFNGRYQLLELVGSGGMAPVYRGLDMLLQRQVAVKVLREGFASDPAFLARFQREARAAARLDHPNVVTVYDVGQDGIRHYIVMEYVDGQDLKTWIRRKGRLDVQETLDLIIQICAGVGHAHKAGIIHCDIKPQNVLVTKDIRAKVTDFGIARALSESGITESDTVWGSPLYFSPEQAAGEPPAPSSDVYSIGITMYEMLAGSPPFQAEKPTALALMHMREEPPSLVVQNPHVPPQLEWIIRKTLSKEPSARYRNAEQLGHILEEYRRQSEQLTGYQPAVTPPPPSALALVESSSPALLPADSAIKARAKPFPTPRRALDGLTWILGLIALIAVIGLIPVWWLVYEAYSAPLPLPPTATPPLLVTSTPGVQHVSVPDVLGKSEDEARAIVERAGLRFVLAEERDDPNAERGIVLEQTPGPGELIPLQEQVSVIVNGQGRELAMPGVTDYPVDMVRNGLESDGLHVAIERVWSPETEGMVLTQEPEQGTTVYTGDTVTLTVSGGVNIPIPLEVNLADQIELQSAELRQETFRPGGLVAVALHWHALRRVDTNYVVFVHLIGPDGRLVAQQDKAPISPTSEWVPGVTSTAPHQVTIRADQTAGLYQLRTGMYPEGEPGQRLQVVDAGQTTAESNSILIAEIQVSP
jgi:serine/threonine protein kinase